MTIITVDETAAVSFFFDDILARSGKPAMQREPDIGAHGNGISSFVQMREPAVYSRGR